MNSIQIKINKAISPYMKDQVVPVQVDEFKTPIHKFWRDRLRDAEVDDCVEIVKATKSKTQPKKESPKEDIK